MTPQRDGHCQPSSDNFCEFGRKEGEARDGLAKPTGSALHTMTIQPLLETHSEGDWHDQAVAGGLLLIHPRHLEEHSGDHHNPWNRHGVGAPSLLFLIFTVWGSRVRFYATTKGNSPSFQPPMPLQTPYFGGRQSIPSLRAKCYLCTSATSVPVFEGQVAECQIAMKEHPPLVEQFLELLIPHYPQRHTTGGNEPGGNL
jgi:hypothetical protein